jgi:hypothetical protein
MHGSLVQRTPSPDRIETLIARCEADQSLHMTYGPCSEAEVCELEEELGRLGPGVYYLKHEIFGARRVMVHDIELLPDLRTFRTQLGEPVSPDVLPIHRQGEHIYAIDLDADPAPVRPLDGVGPSYPDFGTFLEAVVLG